MADTFSLRFEIDASRAEAGAKKFTAAISSINKSLDGLNAKAEAAFSKLMSGGGSGGDFSALAKNLGKLGSVNINPATVKSLNSLGAAFKNLKAPSAASMKNISTFASTIPALLNSFNVSGNFADSVNKISAALGGFKVPATSKVESLKAFGAALQAVAPSLRISGNFSGIANLGTALSGFKAPSETAVSNLKAFFSALNNSGAKASISGGLVNGIINLSSAMAGLKAPSSTSVKNLRDLFSTLGTFKPVSGTSSITAVTQAFANFKGPTASQIKNVQAFVTMLGNLKVPANAPQIAAYIEKIGLAAGTANKFLTNFRTNLSSLGTGKVSSEASGLSTNLRGLENAFSGTFQAASVFRTLIGSITLGTLSKAIYDANTNFNAFKSTMLAVNNGSLTATGESMRYVEDMANRLGQRVQDIQESFGGFAVSASLAGVSTAQTRDIFESTVTAMTVLHRSSDRTKLALLALEQMMSKGNVSSEELRRQLGEQLPGAVNLMARALKVSTSELNDMLKQGAVLSSDALPKFAEEIKKTYGPSLAGSLKNATAQFNMLSNAVNSMFVVIGQSGSMDALAGAFQKAAKALSDPAFLNFSREFGERAAIVIGKMGDAFVWLTKNIDTVVFGLKILLALNIGSFIKSFLGSFVSLPALVATSASSFKALGLAISGITPLATTAATALKGVTAGGTIMAALSGPLGAIVIALGALGLAWYATREEGKKFNEALDSSGEALARYQDRIATFSRAQLISEEQANAKAIAETKKQLDELTSSTTNYQSTRNAARSGDNEFLNLQKDIANANKAFKETGASYDTLLEKVRNANFSSPAAQALADKFLQSRVEADKLTSNLQVLENQSQSLDSALKMVAGNASSFAGAMATMGAAAASMAGQVASAASLAKQMIAELGQSQIAAKFNDQVSGVNAEYEKQQKAIGALGASKTSDLIIDKKLSESTAQRDEALKNIANSIKTVEDATKKFNATQQNTKDITEYSKGITSQERALKKLKETRAAMAGEKSVDPLIQSKALAGIDNDIKEAQEKIAKGNKPGGGGGGAKGAASNLDAAGLATSKYNKELNSLDSMLKKHLITQEQYNTALDKLKAKYADSALGTNGITTEFTKLRDELIPSTAAMDEFLKKKQILDAEFANTGNLAEYTDLMTRLKKQYSEAGSASSSPWISGINKGLTDLTKTSEDFTNDVAGAVTNAFNGLEDALVSWVTTGKMDFKSLATSILGDIARIVIRYTIIQPIIKALSGMFSGLGLGGAGAAGGGFDLGGGMTSFTGIQPFAKGAAFSGGKITAFANGGLTNGSNSGIVNSPTLFNMSGKTGLMGEAGPEGILPLKRGADGSLGVQAHGAAQAVGNTNVSVQPKVNVNIENKNGGDSSVSTKQNKDGSLDVNVLIEQFKSAVAGDIATGGTKLNKAFEGRYGANAASGNKR